MLNVHLKLNCPRRNSLPFELAETNNSRKIRFSEPVCAPLPEYKERRLSCGNDRTLNPSVSDADQSVRSSTRVIRSTLTNPHQGAEHFSIRSAQGNTPIKRVVTSKVSSDQKVKQPKASSTSKSKSEMSNKYEQVKPLWKLTASSVYFLYF